MKKAFRIGYYRYAEDSEFREHIKFIEKYKDQIDEIALFTEYSHRGYWELESQRELSRILKSRISEYKKAGIKSVGLNILDTVGHLDEAWDVLENPDMQTMIDQSGKQSRCCLCPNTEEFKSYIKERYRILAASGPDFIWVDDDLRIHGHYVLDPCFCPSCIQKFNAVTGRNYTFDTLTSEVKNNTDTAEQWNDFWINNYKELCSLIEDAIHSVDPDIKTGLMTIQYETYSEWLDALGAVMGRPGGGYYEDFLPRDILRKFLSCEEQMTRYPDRVRDRQYEFELFPYQEMGKSKKITELECAFALMSGCNGIAFNANFLYDNPSLMDIVKEREKYWSAICERTENTAACGIYTPQYEPYGVRLIDIGVPVTADPAGASVYFLTGETVMRYNDEELLNILSGGVFLDNTAADILTARGFGKYIGVKVLKNYTNGVMERFSESGINSPYEGYIRNAWINFNGSAPNAAVLEPLCGDVEIISDLITIKKDYLGPCTAVYKNELGGKICTTGYLFPTFLQYNAKRTQLLNIFDGLSPLPVRVNKNHKIVPIFRSGKNGGYILMLANMSFDDSGKLTVDIKTDIKKSSRLSKDGSFKDLSFTETADGIRIELENISSWEEVIITN